MSTEALHPFEALMRERIVVLDGAMGTMVQRFRLSEADFRGEPLDNLQHRLLVVNDNQPRL